MQEQQASQFGWAVVSASGGKYHVTRIIGTWYGALEASAICGTRPAARWGQHHGWVDLGRKYETLTEAAQAAGHLLCSKCLKKAQQAAARAEDAEAEALAALKGAGQLDQTEAAYLQQAEALAPVETPAAVELPTEEQRQAEGKAWLAAYEEEIRQQQEQARAAALARADALGITAEAAELAEAAAPFHVGQKVTFDGYRQGLITRIVPAADVVGNCNIQVETLPYRNKVWFDARYLTAVMTEAEQAAALQAVTEALPTAQEAREQRQAEAAAAAVEAGSPALPCQCEHSDCTHAYLSVPAGTAAAMFIGPICDDCVSHMQGYLLQGEEAERSIAEVRHMWEQQQAAAIEAAAAEAAADPAEPGTWAGDYWETCSNCEDGEFHYVVQGKCWSCDLPRLQRIRQAEQAAAEALQEMPNVHTWAVSAMVYLEERGYAVERTIRRNLSRASLPVVMAVLGDRENLSKLSPYPDGMG